MTTRRETPAGPEQTTLAESADAAKPPSPDMAARRLAFVLRRYKRSGGLFVGAIGLWVLGIALVVLTSRAQTAGGNTAPSNAVLAIFKFVFVPPIVLGALVAIVNSYWKSKVCRTVVDAEFRCCANCLYDLRGVAPVGKETPCPECGARADLAESEMLWRAWIGRRQVKRFER